MHFSLSLSIYIYIYIYIYINDDNNDYINNINDNNDNNVLPLCAAPLACALALGAQLDAMSDIIVVCNDSDNDTNNKY